MYVITFEYQTTLCFKWYLPLIFNFIELSHSYIIYDFISYIVDLNMCRLYYVVTISGFEVRTIRWMHNNHPPKLPELLARHYLCVLPDILLIDHNSFPIGQSWSLLDDCFLEMSDQWQHKSELKVRVWS